MPVVTLPGVMIHMGSQHYEVPADRTRLSLQLQGSVVPGEPEVGAATRGQLVGVETTVKPSALTGCSTTVPSSPAPKWPSRERWSAESFFTTAHRMTEVHPSNSHHPSQGVRAHLSPMTSWAALAGHRQRAAGKLTALSIRPVTVSVASPRSIGS